MRFFFLFLLFPLCAAVRTPEDVERLAFFERFSKVETVTEHQIPKTLHFIWLGLSSFPESSAINVRKWKEMHPGFRLCFWTDVEQPKAPCEGVEMRQIFDLAFTELEEPFAKADNFGERAKMLAYEILFQEGGIYIDHDVSPCKSLDSLIGNVGFFCGLEPEGVSVLSSSIYPATHLFGAAKGHEVVEGAMCWLKENWDELEEKHPGTLPLAIFSRAAHRTFWALSEGIQRAQGSDILILPSEAFGDFQASQSSFAIHSHAASWYKAPLSGEDQKLKELLKKEKENSNLVLSLGFLSLGVPVLAFLALRKRAALILFPLLFAPLQADEFDFHMGSETPHWQHLAEERDLKLLKECKALFLEAHPQNKDYLIPPVAHFIWLGPRPFPPESVENVRTWMALHPDWHFKFYTDRLRDPPCKGMQCIQVKEYPFQFLKDRFQETQNWGEKSDILRFEILYREGGVYVDHDAKCLKSFVPFHKSHDFYACFETPHPVVMGRCLTVGSGLVAARPGHPVILRVLDLMERRWDRLNKKYRGSDGYTRMQRVMERTYMPLTEAIEEGVPYPGVVFPAAYFFPKGGIDPIYSEHFFANAWASEEGAGQKIEKNKRQLLGQLKKRSQMNERLLTAFIVINILAFVGLFFYTKKRVV